MLKNDFKHPEFVVHCIEIYKVHKGISGKESYRILKEAGATGFIDDCYERLHCMGNNAIVCDIDEYINNQGSKYCNGN